MISFIKIITYIFYIYFAKLSLQILYWLYKICFRKRKDILNRYGRDSWALITGASDGIGKGFAEELARVGFNIILVARNQSKLENVAKQLKEINHTIDTKIVIYDFNVKNKLSDYEQEFNNLIAEFDISILVNNVGMTYPTIFNDASINSIHEMINLNVVPQCFLTKLILDKLKTRFSRSAIIDISSAASKKSIPYVSQYAASKAFNLFLTKGVEFEERNKIDMLAVTSGVVASNLSTYSSSETNGFSIVTANQCASGCLDSLGYETETSGYWSHQMVNCMSDYYIVVGM